MSVRIRPGFAGRAPRVFVAALLSLVSPLATRAGDWPFWRGPGYDGVSAEKELPVEWDPAGGPDSNLVWRRPELGGRSTPVVLGGKLYTIVRDKPGTELEGEKVVCADAATGDVRWEHRFNVYLSDVPDTRVGWSSVVADPETGRVYAQGVCGYFCCLDGDSGRVVWERSLHEEFGLLSTYGGRTNFPLVYEDTVLASGVMVSWGDTPKWGLMAKPAHRFLAFEKGTGVLRWVSGTGLIPYDTTYSTPTLATLAGQRAIVFGSGDGAVWAMQPGTGKALWKYPLSRAGLNVSPVVGPDGVVYTGQSEENVVGNTMGAVVAIDGNQVEPKGPLDLSGKERWARYQQMVGKSSPVLVDGRLYTVTDSAKLFVFDTATGETVNRRPARLGRVMRGSLVHADGKIYAVSENGVCSVWRPTDAGVEKLFERQLVGEQVDASPIVAHGRLYITTGEAMYCVATKESVEANSPGAAASSDSSAVGAEVKVEDKRVTHVQLVPWETLLGPGEEQTYRVRLYNGKGEFLRVANPTSVTFGVSGPGDVTREGVYKAPETSTGDVALVLCEYEGVAAEGRVRVVPPLPWRYDFEDGADDVPPTWVGGRVRYVKRADGRGNHYLAKPTELPTRPGAPTTKLGTRSQMLMGSPKLANYTVQADFNLREGVSGEVTAGVELPEGPPAVATAVKLPTAGVINSGYTFSLFGPNQEARLYSWCTHDKRTQATKPMELRADLWYRVKLTVIPDREKNVATVKAKVWPAADAEPDAWTLEFVDEAPQFEGSPGLFGDSKEAEFYLDNLSVTPNN